MLRRLLEEILTPSELGNLALSCKFYYRQVLDSTFRAAHLDFFERLVLPPIPALLYSTAPGVNVISPGAHAVQCTEVNIISPGAHAVQCTEVSIISRGAHEIRSLLRLQSQMFEGGAREAHATCEYASERSTLVGEWGRIGIDKSSSVGGTRVRMKCDLFATMLLVHESMLSQYRCLSIIRLILT